MALTEKKLTIAVAESCTGGLIANRLTDVPGSSVYFERGLVTYSNEAKIQLLGVPAEIIESARRCERRNGAPDGRRRPQELPKQIWVCLPPALRDRPAARKEKPVGTVYMALADGSQTICRHYAYRWDRKRNKVVSSEAALFLLKNYLQGKV